MRKKCDLSDFGMAVVRKCRSPGIFQEQQFLANKAIFAGSNGQTEQKRFDDSNNHSVQPWRWLYIALRRGTMKEMRKERKRVEMTEGLSHCAHNPAVGSRAPSIPPGVRGHPAVAPPPVSRVQQMQMLARSVVWGPCSHLLLIMATSSVSAPSI